MQIETENAPLVQGGTIQHLLWALLLMNKFVTYGVMAKICDADEKTIHKRSWPFIVAIAELEGQVVSLPVSISAAFGGLLFISNSLQLTAILPAWLDRLGESHER